jgi:hypothetical protein
MTFEPYRLQDMGGERAIRILSTLLAELSDIDPSEMTTFELNILRACAENPPALEGTGVEDKLVRQSV